MSELLKSLNQILHTAKTWVAEKTAPIRAAWSRFTAPVAAFFAPVTGPWRRLTAPLRDRWAQFRQRHPAPGFVLGWLGTFMKWGFNLLLFLIFGVWIGLFGRLPSMEELKSVETANSTEIYTIDSVLIGKYFIENRTAVSLDKVSPFIINALIATEDRRFLEHSGIDFMSWLRVVKGMATGSEGLGGGSTLSQQLAKNLFLSGERSMARKAQEGRAVACGSSQAAMLSASVRPNDCPNSRSMALNILGI